MRTPSEKNRRMADWQNGRMAVWQNGSMAERENGRTGEWQNGRMAVWQNGMPPLSHHRLWLSIITELDYWNGILEWNTGLTNHSQTRFTYL